MVRTRRAKDAHHARERGIHAGTHVHGLGAKPDGFDPNHRNHSRSRAAQSRAAAAGQADLSVSRPAATYISRIPRPLG